MKKYEIHPAATIFPMMTEEEYQGLVGRATVARAKAVREHGSKAVQDAVEQGKLAVSLAAKLVKKVPDKQSQESILQSGTNAVREAVADVDVDQAQIDEFIRLWKQCSEVARIGIRSWLAENDPGTWMTTPEIPNELC